MLIVLIVLVVFKLLLIIPQFRCMVADCLVFLEGCEVEVCLLVGYSHRS